MNFKAHKTWERDRVSLSQLLFIKGFPGGSVVNNLPANARDAGDMGLILELGRSPEEGNDNPLQYSCLRNPLDRGAWRAMDHSATKESDSTEQLNNNNLHSHETSYEQFSDHSGFWWFSLVSRK